MKYKFVTWEEFKKEVERSGIQNNSILRYIDIDFPLYADLDYEFNISVKQDESKKFVISRKD